MSELREECYKCLNNQECFSGADYGSIYCARNRRFKMPLNEDYTMKFATMQKQIDNLTAQLANSISKDVIKEKILNPIQAEKQNVYNCFMNKKLSDDFVIDGTVLQELSYIEALVQELLNT